MKFGKKVSNSIKKGFDSEPVYNEKCLKTKIKTYEGKTNTILHSDKKPKEGSHCTCPSVIFIDSVLGAVENYYPQVFLEECKFA